MSRLRTSQGDIAQYSFPKELVSRGVDVITGELYGAYMYEVSTRRRTFIPDDGIQDLTVRIGRWMATTSKTGLLLYGKVGTGKTTMMRAMLDVVRNASSAWNASSLCNSTGLVDHYLAHREGQNSRYLDYAEARILFIDDLGSEPMRCLTYGMERTPLLDILYHRYNRQLITVISSNLEDNDLTERYGARLQDRMEESYDKIYYSGASYRRKLK